MEMNFEGMNKTAIRNKVREDLTKEFLEFLIEKHGEFLEDGASKRVGQTGSNEVGVVVGKAPDNDGFVKDVVALVKVSVPAWWYSVGEAGRQTNAYDFEEAVANWDYTVEQKKIKAEKKKK